MARKPATRDLEKTYGTAAFVAKLRRFADALEQGKPFVIQIAGERVRVPARAASPMPGYFEFVSYTTAPASSS